MFSASGTSDQPLGSWCASDNRESNRLEMKPVPRSSSFIFGIYPLVTSSAFYRKERRINNRIPVVKSLNNKISSRTYLAKNRFNSLGFANGSCHKRTFLSFKHSTFLLFLALRVSRYHTTKTFFYTEKRSHNYFHKRLLFLYIFHCLLRNG